jgi:hypothetical protein
LIGKINQRVNKILDQAVRGKTLVLLFLQNNKKEEPYSQFVKELSD